MTEDFYQNLLRQWCPGASPSEALVRVFEKVRDIPYGSTGERNPRHILQANIGSCSGKHILLNNLFRALGFESKVLTCLHHFNEALPSGNTCPPRLREMMRNYKIIDFHHFIKLQNRDKRLDVDATWDALLKDYGFPVNLDWDGESDTTIAVKPITFYPETEDIAGLKKRLIAELSPKDRKIRREFMRLLTDWLRQIRSRAG